MWLQKEICKRQPQKERRKEERNVPLQGVVVTGCQTVLYIGSLFLSPPLSDRQTGCNLVSRVCLVEA